MWLRRISCRCALADGGVRSFAAQVRPSGRVHHGRATWRATAAIWRGDLLRREIVGWGRTRDDAVEALRVALRLGWPEAGTDWRPGRPP